MVEAYAAPAAPNSYVHLSTADLDAVYALHLVATGAVGRPDLIKPESRDFFERVLSGGGSIVGAMRGGVLIGYGVLQVDLPPSEDARPAFGLSSSDRLAKLAGAAVLPAAWGDGIHDALIALRVDEARRLGIGHVYATAAPGNARSWQNLLDAGFAVRGMIEKYGGHLRYLLHRDLGAPEAAAGTGEWCSVDDIARQRSLIAAGWAGNRWRRRDGGQRDLWYRSPA